jgi:hypothetical protein
MSKTLSIGLAIIIIAGAAYYFGVAKPKAASEGGEVSSAMPAPGSSNVEEMVVGGEYTEVDPVLVGTWRSKDDTKFTREFKADGTMTDRYQGDASATETASFVTINPSVVEVPGVPAANLAGMTVIRVDFSSGPMFFSINSMTDKELSMTNLSGRGNILTFTKAK